MSDWKELSSIKVEEFDKKALHRKICQTLRGRNKYWIAEVDLFVTYKLYDSIKEMAEEIWCEWPSDNIDEFREEHQVDDEVPFVISEHCRQYYVFETTELANEFIKESIGVIMNNPTEDEMQ